jgi:glyoxylase-like metal-dependent hydrolase (beta-lactamase superfamily II)/8-oxo-dGTP pyrophosphatase MutT (NUDIX family)
VTEARTPVDAAAVLVFERHAGRLLWVKRSGELAFAPGFHALPGGRLDAEDESIPSTGGDDLPLRVAALRELFEETGVLVADRAVSAGDRATLRAGFDESAAEGSRRMRALGLRFETRPLVPAGRWVTPAHAPVAVRYDTRFFAIAVDQVRELSADGREVDDAELVGAHEALARFERAEVLLGPPLLEMLRVLARWGFDPAACRDVSGADGAEGLRWEVVPGLAVLPLRTPTLPPATHTNAFLVGTREALLVEPASPWPEEVDLAVRWIRDAQARGITPKAIVATHHHADHVGGAVALKERLGLPLWGHRATAERLDGLVSFERLLDDGDRLEIDGPTPMTLEVVHTPGHAPGHLCFVESSSRAMIAGDMVASVGTIIVEPIDGDMQMYLDSLRKMAAGEPSMLLPAHGGPIREAQEKLDHYERHRLFRERKVMDALGAHGAPARVRDLVPVAYDDADPKVWPLAQGSTEAHLIKLAREGRVDKRGDRWVLLT